ncbi:metal-dependent amidase/aminoacylase/carboxypeptidase [Amylocarpus encephaloides]|uniref:Peptidase M20 domain-containing protein 2 n=1 Tax=Amylocarpus encephaloides TaxID=45428 RepID=A0A9P7YMD5_9HELO|nr:metal-dependent amidase/aminoacylase/carboxypeptidase [Amylocarpus encephaloides]
MTQLSISNKATRNERDLPEGNSPVCDSIYSTIDAEKPGLQDINQRIHANPEICFKEYLAHDNITEFLEDRGFTVQKHAYGLETSFEAQYGEGGRLIVFNAEYDALPTIGHACGHNLIATSAIAALLGVVAALKLTGIPGRVRILGTPAEEGGGGKINLIDQGAYKGVDACLMLHPGPPPKDSSKTGSAYVTTLATTSLHIEFYGKAAHAAMTPQEGVNALDAVVLGYNAVSMLRQQTLPYERIHGIISHGGDASNIIPAEASLEYGMRSKTYKEVLALEKRVIKCFDAAALATGCTVSYMENPRYADLQPNKVLCKLYADSMGKLGSPVILDTSDSIAASTDMGNVTYICPGFHAMFGIPVTSGSLNHTPGFTACAGTLEAFRCSIEAAKGMAFAGWQVLEDAAVAKSVWDAFNKGRKDLARLADAELNEIRMGVAKSDSTV